MKTAIFFFAASLPAYAQVLIEPINPLPEPNTIALLALGLGLIGWRWIRKRWK